MPSSTRGNGRIIAQGVATTTATAVYGPSTTSNIHMEILGLILSNESESATTISYGVCKSGGTVGAAGTSSAKTAPIAAAGSASSTIDATELEGVILGQGDSVWVQAGAGSAVAYTLAGTEFSV